MNAGLSIDRFHQKTDAYAAAKSSSTVKVSITSRTPCKSTQGWLGPDLFRRQDCEWRLTVERRRDGEDHVILLPAFSFGSLNQSREMNSKDFHSRPRYSTLRDESHPSFTCVCVKVAQSCSTPGDPIQSMGFSRPEHWSGEPVPSPGDLPNLGIDPGLLHCRQILYQLGHQGSHSLTYRCSIIFYFFLSAFGCHAVSRCGLVFIHPATISVQSFSLKPHIFLTFCKILAYFSCILPVYHAVPLELIWDVLNLLPSLCPPCLLTSHWYFPNFLS